MNTCWQPASALTLRQVPWRLSSEGLGLVNFHILQKQLSSWIIYDWEQLWLEALGIHKRSSLPSRLWDDVWKAIWISYKIGIQIKLYLCFSIFQLLIWKPENLNDCATYSLTWSCVNFEGGKTLTPDKYSSTGTQKHYLLWWHTLLHQLPVFL